MDPLGIGDSDKPLNGYDTGSIGAMLHATMAQLGHSRYSLVGHDIGMWIGYAMASDFPHAVERVVLTEAVSPVWHPFRRFLSHRKRIFSFGTSCSINWLIYPTPSQVAVKCTISAIFSIAGTTVVNGSSDRSSSTPGNGISIIKGRIVRP